MHFSLRAVMFLVGLVALMAGITLGNIAMWRMVEEVNKGRKSGTEISRFGWNLVKSANVIMLYRSVQPNGRLLKRRNLALTSMVVGFVILAGALFAG